MIELKLNMPNSYLTTGNTTLDQAAKQYVEKCKEDFDLYPNTQGLTILNAEADRDALVNNFQYVLRRYKSSGGLPQELFFGMGVFVGTRYECKVTVGAAGKDAFELVWQFNEVK